MSVAGVAAFVLGAGRGFGRGAVSGNVVLFPAFVARVGSLRVRSSGNVWTVNGLRGEVCQD